MANAILLNNLGYYVANSTDIADNKIPGANIIGMRVYLMDTNAWKIVTEDLTLDDFVIGSTAIESSDNLIGKIREEKVLEITLVLDGGNAYVSGDVMAITASFSGTRVNGGSLLPLSMIVIDEDDNGGAFDIVFFKTMVNIGTINNPVDLTDAEMSDYLGRIVVTSADYYDWGGQKTAIFQPGDSGWKISSVFQSASDSTNLYIAAISRDTKTYTTSGIKLRFAISR